jgi:hypothetical protein
VTVNLVERRGGSVEHSAADTIRYCHRLHFLPIKNGGSQLGRGGRIGFYGLGHKSKTKSGEDYGTEKFFHNVFNLRGAL